MIERIGTDTLRFQEGPAVVSWASVVGKKEAEGPLGEYFDACHEDTSLGTDSWEKAESHLQTESVEKAMKKAMLEPEQLQIIFAGDLLNQCISSTFGLRDLRVPFLGQYGACSTMAQTLGMASLFVEAGAARHAAAVTSSHFCSAERQFRLPLEYGGQRPPTAQWTATASGSVIVGKRKDAPGSKVFVRDVCFGRITDLGVSDANNMGPAMAPAAASTLLSYWKDTGTSPRDFDLILTGDLGRVGSDLLGELLRREGIEIAGVQNDGGLMLYEREEQDVHAGGSGCGCSAAVLCSLVLRQMQAGELKRVLFVGTGALMSTTSSQQGETIPGIAHLVALESGAGGTCETNRTP